MFSPNIVASAPCQSATALGRLDRYKGEVFAFAHDFNTVKSASPSILNAVLVMIPWVVIPWVLFVVQRKLAFVIVSRQA